MGLDGSEVRPVSRLEVLEGPSGRRVHSEAERAWIVADSLLPGAQVSDAARKHGARADRFTIDDDAFGRKAHCRRAKLRSRHSRRRSSPIPIGDVAVRTDAAIDKEQLSRVIRAVRASR